MPDTTPTTPATTPAVEGTVSSELHDSNHITVTNLAPYRGDINIIPEGMKLSEVLSIIVYYLGVLDQTAHVLDKDLRDKLDKFVAPAEGMGFSSNDFTDEDKKALEDVVKELEKRSLLTTDSNHVTITNIQTIAKGELEHGDTLSTALSKLQYMFGILHYKLKDEYLDKGQIDKEYVHRRTGQGLSSNDFDDDYKALLDHLTTDDDSNPTYTKQHIDDTFVKKDGAKVLSTNDFTDEYRNNLVAITKKLDDNYLSLLGGNMTNHRITFEVGGGLTFNGIDQSVETTLDKDFYTGTAYKAIRVGNMVATERSKEYNVGDTVFTENLPIGLYLYCKTAGTTAVLEPTWNTTPGGETIDGTTTWVTRRFSSLYSDDGEEIKTEYLGSNGGAMNGAINMNSHDIKFTTGGVKFANGTQLTEEGLKGNADTATKLQLPFKINGFSVDGTEDVELDYIPKDEKSRPYGVATLDAHGRVPVNQLPSFVRSVENVKNYQSLPRIGNKEIIYITNDNNEIYRWSGTAYINVSPDSATSEATIKLVNPRNIGLTGSVAGNAYFDGSEDITIETELNRIVMGGKFGNTGQYVPSFTLGDDGRISAIENRKVVVPFNEITNKPTTLAGYGITDGITPSNLNLLADVYLALAGGNMTGNIVMNDDTKIAGKNSGVKVHFKSDELVIGSDTKDAIIVNDGDAQSSINTYDYTFGFMSPYRATDIDSFRQKDYDRVRTITSLHPFNTFDVFKGAELKNETNSTAMSIGFGQDKTTAILQISPSNHKVRVGGGTNITLDWKDTIPTEGGTNTFTGTNKFTGPVDLSADNTTLGGRSLNAAINGAIETKTAIDIAYPVGSIYMTTDANFDPNVSWRGTFWEQSDTRNNITFGSVSATTFVWRRQR